MRKEIDLRDREFVQASRFTRKRAARAVLAAAATGLLLLCYCWSQYYLEAMRRELAELKAANQRLAEQVKPLEQMEKEIKLLEAKAAREREIRESTAPYSRYLRLIEAAAPDTVIVEAISITDYRQLTVNGRGSSMHLIAGYHQALSRLAFISDPPVSSIDLAPDQSYRFVIKAALENGGASIDVEKR
ncbi:MAG: hypothetical protein AB1767_10755 [Bacillota bacterium]